MIKIAVCDDTELDLQIITNLIHRHLKERAIEYKILTFENGADLLESHKKACFDFVFLDIYLKDSNGIDIAEELNRVSTSYKLILTTSSREHSLDGYRVFAFNYLIKPLDEAAFHNVLSKLVENILVAKQKTLLIKSGDSFTSVLHNEILYVESNARKINVHTIHNATLSCYAKLDQIEKEINNVIFLRCHKSFLVNMDYVYSIENNLFFMRNNAIVPITQKDFVSMRKRYLEYISGKISIDD